MTNATATNHSITVREILYLGYSFVKVQFSSLTSFLEKGDVFSAKIYCYNANFNLPISGFVNDNGYFTSIFSLDKENTTIDVLRSIVGNDFELIMCGVNVIRKTAQPINFLMGDENSIEFFYCITKGLEYSYCQYTGLLHFCHNRELPDEINNLYLDIVDAPVAITGIANYIENLRDEVWHYWKEGSFHLSGSIEFINSAVTYLNEHRINKNQIFTYTV